MPSGSKTSLGSLVYALDHLPSFYVAEIETLDKDGNQCLSRRLRCSAVKNLLKKRDILDSFAVNHNAKRNQLTPRTQDNTGPIDHLIFRCESTRDIQTPILKNLLSRDSEVVEEKEFRRTLDGTLERRNVRCRFISGRLVRPDPNNAEEQKLYSRCLDTFICTRASKDINGRRTDTNPANKDWLLSNPSEFDTSLKTKGLAQFCSLMTRAEPVLKLDAKELHLKLDLVFCLDQDVMVPDLLFEYLGNNILGPVSAEKFALIKGVLIGQEVQYLDPEKRKRNAASQGGNPIAEKVLGTLGHRPIVRKDSKFDLQPSTPDLQLRHKRSRADFGSPSPSDKVWTSTRKTDSPGRRPDNRPAQDPSRRNIIYKIQDTKSSAEVSKFVSQRTEEDTLSSIFEETEVKPMSVIAYFEKVKQCPLKYSHLPLAKVGQETWIPLEFLQLSKGQMLRNTGHLTDFVKNIVPNMEQYDQEQKRIFDMFDQEEHFLLNEGAHRLTPIFNQGPGKHFMPAKTSTRRNRKEPEVDPRRAVGEDSSSLKARLVYIPSTSSGSEESEKYLKFVSDALHNATNSKGSTIKFSKPERTLIEIEKPLSMEAHVGDNSGADNVLIGIVDDSGRTKAAVDQIKADIHRYADQVNGCIALCVTKKTLDRSFLHNSNTDNPYFPQGLLHKINFMLGGTNHKSTFAAGPLHTIAENMRSIASDAGTISKHADSVGKAMIFGAHLSHPGSLAGTSCPSVAAVVSSRNDALHYFGAARIQPTMRETSQREGHGRVKPGIKHIMQSRILGLKSMIKERMEQDAKIPAVVFFRHGLNPELEGHVIEKEQADIKEALAELGFARSLIKLTYIVVSRGSPVERSGELMGGSGFTFGSKHRYSIKYNELEIIPRMLQELVERLNQSNQLGGEVSVALPIHFAQKLATRVFDYFHYYAIDSASTVPEIIDQLRDQDRHHGYQTDREMRQIIEKHLYRGLLDNKVSEPDSESTAVNPPKYEQDSGSGSEGSRVSQESNRRQISEPVMTDRDDQNLSEVERLEQEEIDIINFLKTSPWQECLNKTMFYL